MTIESVHEEFAKLMKQRAIHNKFLPESATTYERKLLSGKIRRYRFILKQGGTVSIVIKMKLLQKAGVKLEGRNYSRSDMISFVNFFKCQSQSAKTDPIYALEKWELSMINANKINKKF